MDLLLQSQRVVVNVNSIVLAVHDGDLVGSTEKTSLKREQCRVSGGCVFRRISKSLPRSNPSRQQRWFAWQQRCQRCAWKDQETFWCYKSIKYKVESSSILIVIVVIDHQIGRTKYNQRRKPKPGRATSQQDAWRSYWNRNFFQPKIKSQSRQVRTKKSSHSATRCWEKFLLQHPQH